MAKEIRNIPLLDLPFPIQRLNAVPLDPSSFFKDELSARNYAKNGKTAYIGQLLTVITDQNITFFVILDDQGNLLKISDQKDLENLKNYIDTENIDINNKIQKAVADLETLILKETENRKDATEKLQKNIDSKISNIEKDIVTVANNIKEIQDDLTEETESLSSLILSVQKKLENDDAKLGNRINTTKNELLLVIDEKTEVNSEAISDIVNTKIPNLRNEINSEINSKINITERKINSSEIKILEKLNEKETNINSSINEIKDTIIPLTKEDIQIDFNNKFFDLNKQLSERIDTVETQFNEQINIVETDISRISERLSTEIESRERNDRDFSEDLSRVTNTVNENNEVLYDFMAKINESTIDSKIAAKAAQITRNYTEKDNEIYNTLENTLLITRNDNEILRNKLQKEIEKNYSELDTKITYLSTFDSETLDKLQEINSFISNNEEAIGLVNDLVNLKADKKEVPNIVKTNVTVSELVNDADYTTVKELKQKVLSISDLKDDKGLATVSFVNEEVSKINNNVGDILQSYPGLKESIEEIKKILQGSGSDEENIITILQEAIGKKQDKLVDTPGELQNIKTINGSSILGTGDLHLTVEDDIERALSEVKILHGTNKDSGKLMTVAEESERTATKIINDMFGENSAGEIRLCAGRITQFEV